MGFVVLVLAAWSWSVAWAVLTVYTARLLAVPIADVRLGFGPSRTIGAWGGIDWKVGAVPLGASVGTVDEVPVPLAVGAGPALLLGSVAGGLAPPPVSIAILQFLVPMLTFGTPAPPGLMRALALAAELATVDPIGVWLGLWGTLGVLNALLGALQQLTRLGPVGIGVYLVVQLWLLVCVVRALALDFLVG